MTSISSNWKSLSKDMDRGCVPRWTGAALGSLIRQEWSPSYSEEAARENVKEPTIETQPSPSNRDGVARIDYQCRNSRRRAERPVIAELVRPPISYFNRLFGLFDGFRVGTRAARLTAMVHSSDRKMRGSQGKSGILSSIICLERPSLMDLRRSTPSQARGCIGRSPRSHAKRSRS